MIPLTMDKIPSITSDTPIYLRREVIVLVCWPGSYAANMHTVRLLNSGESTAHVRRQYRDIDVCTRQSPTHLIYVRLKTPYIWKVACCHKKYTQRVGLSWHP